MHVVSEAGESLMALLVSWELMGRIDLDPHQLLREVSEEDLTLVQGNINQAPEVRDFVSIELVELEVMYRHGLLDGDWSVERNGDEVTLNFVLSHHTHWGPNSERITA